MVAERMKLILVFARPFAQGPVSSLAVAGSMGIDFTLAGLPRLAILVACW
jgi:hypothetical protein